MKPGLLILPSDCTQRYRVVPESTDYACTRCSEIIYMEAGEKRLHPRRANPEWMEASRAKRVVWQQKHRLFANNPRGSFV